MLVERMHVIRLTDLRCTQFGRRTVEFVGTFPGTAGILPSPFHWNYYVLEVVSVPHLWWAYLWPTEQETPVRPDLVPMVSVPEVSVPFFISINTKQINRCYYHHRRLGLKKLNTYRMVQIFLFYYPCILIHSNKLIPRVKLRYTITHHIPLCHTLSKIMIREAVRIYNAHSPIPRTSIGNFLSCCACDHGD